MPKTQPEFSIVIPLLNEEENLKLLHQRLTSSMELLDQPYEIIFIDDGSSDGSLQVLRELLEQDALMQIIQFRQNFVPGRNMLK